MELFWNTITIGSVIFALVTFYIFVKRNGISKAVLFFSVLTISAIVLEGLAIKGGVFQYNGNYQSVWSVPIPVVFYWYAMYYLFLIYKRFGNTAIGILKVFLVHIILDSFILTPIAILIGYWSFSNTVFASYPYISLETHIGEAVYALLFFLVFRKGSIK